MLAVTVAVASDLPVRDPDGRFGPSWVRLPLIVAAMVALDVLPRVVAQVRRGGQPREVVSRVWRQRWPHSRLAAVAARLASSYLACVAYRNLKGFLPFVGRSLEDRWLVESDGWLTGGPPG